MLQVRKSPATVYIVLHDVFRVFPLLVLNPTRLLVKIVWDGNMVEVDFWTRNKASFDVTILFDLITIKISLDLKICAALLYCFS